MNFLIDKTARTSFSNIGDRPAPIANLSRLSSFGTKIASSDEEEEIQYCDHYYQWKDLEKEIEILSAKKSEVSCKIEKIERQLEDFEDFYDQFGADNQQNSA